MELGDDGSLAHVIHKGMVDPQDPMKKIAFPEKKCRRWFMQIASAVHYMHQNRLSHRDLKVQNIMLKRPPNKQPGNWTCKLADFGLSRVTYSNETGPIMSKNRCGTVQYMAPEIYCLEFVEDRSKREAYDPMAADIWALGIVLYAMLCAAYPFDTGKGYAALTHMKRYPHKLKYTSIRRKAPISDECEDLIRRSTILYRYLKVIR